MASEALKRTVIKLIDSGKMDIDEIQASWKSATPSAIAKWRTEIQLKDKEALFDDLRDKQTLLANKSNEYFRAIGLSIAGYSAALLAVAGWILGSNFDWLRKQSDVTEITTAAPNVGVPMLIVLMMTTLYLGMAVSLGYLFLADRSQLSSIARMLDELSESKRKSEGSLGGLRIAVGAVFAIVCFFPALPAYVIIVNFEEWTRMIAQPNPVMMPSFHVLRWTYYVIASLAMAASAEFLIKRIAGSSRRKT